MKAECHYSVSPVQDLSVSGGVESEDAEAICAQYGARLVSSSSLADSEDLLELYRARRRRERREEEEER